MITFIIGVVLGIVLFLAGFYTGRGTAKIDRAQAVIYSESGHCNAACKSNEETLLKALNKSRENFIELAATHNSLIDAVHREREEFAKLKNLQKTAPLIGEILGSLIESKKHGETASNINSHKYIPKITEKEWRYAVDNSPLLEQLKSLSPEEQQKVFIEFYNL